MPADRSVLSRVNRRFYREHAEAFDGTREWPWRCWRDTLPFVDEAAKDGTLRVLDAGCGNGRYLRWLTGARAGLSVRSFGLDLSLPLVAHARRRLGWGPDRRWAVADIGEWPLRAPGRFDLAVAWGVLHHLPEARQREETAARLAESLRPRGVVLLSVWAFDRPRFDDRRLDPEEAGRRAGFAIPVEILEPADAFFGFGNSPDAVRYCRLVDLPELRGTAERAGLDVLAAVEDATEPNRWIVARSP